MKIIFASSAEIGKSALKELIKSSHQIQAIYTQTDKPSGRGLAQKPNAIKQLALKHKIPIYQPEDLNDHLTQLQIKSLHADCMIVIAYGMILPSTIINMFKFGCINGHASLLPRWRGASPIQQAILHGDEETGISWIQMNEKLDQGDLLTQYPVDIKPNINSETLYQNLAKTMADTIVKTLSQIENHQLQPQKQEHQFATYAPKIKKDDGLIDWNQNAKKIERQIRAMQPWPKAFSFWKNKRIIIHDALVEKNKTEIHKSGVIQISDYNKIQVHCLNDIITIKSLQLEGKKQQDADQFLLGCQIKTGDKLKNRPHENP